MNSGKLRHRITIQTYTETVQNDGGVVRTWSTFAQRWASWKQVSAAEVESQADQIEGRVVHQFRIRKTDDVTQDMRIVYDSRTFNITGVVADATDKRWQLINTIEIGETV